MTTLRNEERLPAPPIPMMRTNKGPRIVVFFAAFLLSLKATVVLLAIRYGIVNTAAVAAVVYGLYRTVWKLPSSPLKLHEAESKLLNSIEGVIYEQRPVEVNGITINSVRFVAKDATGPKKVLVMLHGLGAGLGVWSKNVAELSATYDIWCVDLLGFGRSSSPPFTGETQDDALKWWTDSIHAWRLATLKDARIDLLGHSLGGFIATAYALSYEVDKLILAAPVGVSSITKRLQSLPLLARMSFRMLHALRITRTKMTRVLGPVAAFIVKKILDRRATWYGFTTPELKEYVFHLQCADSTGEDAFLATVCPVTGWRKPLITQVAELKATQLNLIFGERDFVDSSSGPEIAQFTTIPTKVTILEDVGHHMYTTVPSLFNRHVLE
eukprot:TRINITY_DN20449_c0_g1_i1.p1 TRINITY_DN20449_c0_g1~~TRINITY_DN20449_c0_g1_i1.p1  ORF type:complete len:383 (+),score=85.22 TRINITY_DN20449_c0_g1_i1:38-1186(+)